MPGNPASAPQRAIRAITIATLLPVLVAAPLPASETGGSPYPPRYTLFESGQVRPLALDPEGRFLYAVNTPDDRLEIFRLRDDGSPHAALQHVGSVRVGLEPVAVAARAGGEVWVVNHLSDSISIVDASNPRHARVVRTLLVGDEPRDIVFAGPDRRRAFITTAHRGQNHPLDPQLTTAGIGRADVWVFDTEELAIPETIVTLFTDTPRALAVNADGSRVYAAAFHSGNRSTTLHDLLVTNGGASAPDGRGLPAPNSNIHGLPGPETGLIVRHDGEHWRDADGRTWDDRVRFNLPDHDVFVLEALADPPHQLAGAPGSYSGVGTVLFNMAVSADGGTPYRAAFGSRKIGVLSTAALESDTLLLDAASAIELSGGGPTGLVLDEERARLYVLTRFDNTVSVIDLASRREIARRPLFNPEPVEIITGRPFIYDARATSSNGTVSCASCHVIGDLDSPAWDLGDPEGSVLGNPGPFAAPAFFPEPVGAERFHPLKGPTRDGGHVSSQRAGCCRLAAGEAPAPCREVAGDLDLRAPRLGPATRSRRRSRRLLRSERSECRLRSAGPDEPAAGLRPWYTVQRRPTSVPGEPRE